MCGRFVVSYTYKDLLNFMSSTFDIFDLDSTIEVPRYNVAPGTNVLSIINDGENFRAGNLKWGYIPSFAKDEKSSYKMINARVEGVENKPAFRDSFRSRRCLILADGYYEWKLEGKRKLPYLIKKEDSAMFFFAGLYSKYVNQQNEVVFTCTIITKEASNDLSFIHDRMPIILSEENAKKWLTTVTNDESELLEILENSIDQKLTNMRVSELVNSVKNDSEECVKEYFENTLL